MPLFSERLLDDLLQPGERAAADEQDVARVDLQELLLRMLAAALRRHDGHRAFDQLQQRLLHAFARHVAGDRRVVRLAGDLVDLVDVDDAALRLLDIVVALLQQLLDDVLDILAHVAGFGQRGGIGDRERHVEQARQRLAPAASCRSRSGRSAGCCSSPARPRPCCARRRTRAACSGCRPPPTAPSWRALADDVLVEDVLDFLRRGQLVAARPRRVSSSFLTDDVVAQLDALVADEDRRTRQSACAPRAGSCRRTSNRAVCRLRRHVRSLSHSCPELPAERSRRARFGPRHITGMRPNRTARAGRQAAYAEATATTSD